MNIPFRYQSLLVGFSLICICSACSPSTSTISETTTNQSNSTTLNEYDNPVLNSPSTSDQDYQASSLRPSSNELFRSTDQTLITDQNWLDVLSKNDSINFFKKFTPKNQQFTINPQEEKIIIGQQGTFIAIPANAFVFEDGTPVKGQVSFTLKEYYDKSTIVLAGLGTMTDKGFLESGGMIHIDAKADNKKVKLQKSLYIELPTQNTQPQKQSGMQVYLASETQTPPTTWTNTEEDIKVIPTFQPHLNFYDWKSMGTKRGEVNTYKKICECETVLLAHEMLESTSQTIALQESKSYAIPSFKKVEKVSKRWEYVPTPKDIKTLFSNSEKGVFKETDTIRVSLHDYHKFDFYPSNIPNEQIIYDTVQFLVTMNKHDKASVTENLNKESLVDDITFMSAVSTGGGLRFKLSYTSNKSCDRQNRTFYIRSRELWKDLLSQKRKNHRTWKKIQLEESDSRKPTFVWTGVLAIKKHDFIEESSTQSIHKTYIGKINQEKQARFELWYAEKKKHYDTYMASIAATEQLTSYAFQTTDLGWINCDRFYKVSPAKKTDLIVDTREPVRLIFKKINAVMKSSVRDNNHVFANIPKNEEVTLFSVRKKQDKIFMALHHTIVSNVPVSLTYQEVTLEELQDALQFLNKS